MNIAKIIGLTAAVLSIIILGIVTTVIETKISKKENEINDLENEKEILFLNWQDHQRYNLQELLYRQDMYLTMILDDTQEIKGERDKITKEKYNQEILLETKLMKNARLKSIDKWYTVATGNFASQEIQNKWEKMTRSELKSEEEQIAIKGNEKRKILIDTIKSKKTELKNLKSCRFIFILVAITLQVIGLILITVFKNSRRENI